MCRYPHSVCNTINNWKDVSSITWDTMYCDTAWKHQTANITFKSTMHRNHSLLIQHDTIYCDTEWYNAMQYSMIHHIVFQTSHANQPCIEIIHYWYNLIQYINNIKYSMCCDTTWYNLLRYSMIQYIAIQHDTLYFKHCMQIVHA